MKKLISALTVAVALTCVSQSYAQDLAIVEDVFVDEGGTVLSGQTTTDFVTSDFVDLDFVDGSSFLLVDDVSGEFLMFIQSPDPLISGIATGESNSGASLLVVLPPNAPRWPLAGGDTPQHPDSTPITPETDDGTYIYVMDDSGIVHILPHQNHNHPEILGGDQPATGAGELTIEDGVVTEINNLSGHFRFHPDSLWMVRVNLEDAGIDVADDAENPWTGGY